MSTHTHDLIIVGAGPGGYVAAERAAARGLKTLLVEKRELGGVCLNEGCIPSKTLLYSAKTFSHAAHASVFGVELAGAPRFNLPVAIARKRKVVETLVKGIGSQMKRFGVEVVRGAATLTAPTAIEVEGRAYAAPHLLLATGSSPIVPPIPGADLPHVFTSTGILDRETMPGTLVVIGGGVIGMEFASFFGQVGVPVTVIEMLPEVLPPFEPDFARALRKAFPANVTFKTGCKVERIAPDRVLYRDGDAVREAPADTVLMAIGRRPNTAGLGLERIGLDFDPRLGVRVDERLRTNLPGLFAVGDVNGRSQLAHSASRMGEVAVNTILGRPDRMRYDAIPWVVYTNPELARVGLTEAQARERGCEPVAAQLQLRANGRFLAEHDRENGLVRLVADKRDGRILGVTVLGGCASELIYGAVLLLEAQLRVQDLRDTVMPHPTVSELLRDAAWEWGH